MATLPTVTLRRPRDGDKRIINQTDYARDISRWTRKGYKIIGLKGGNATDLQVQEAADQSDIEKMRRTHPKREKWSGDKERAFKERAIHTSSDVTVGDPDETPPYAARDSDGWEVGAGTITDATPNTIEVAEQSEPAKLPTSDPAWRELKPWAARQRYVQKVTGFRPTSMKHAERLMDNHT